MLVSFDDDREEFEETVDEAIENEGEEVPLAGISLSSVVGLIGTKTMKLLG